MFSTFLNYIDYHVGKAVWGYKPVGKLHKAARHGNVAKVSRLLYEGTNVDDADRKHRTPLHYACTYGQPEVVTLLINMKCSLNIGDNNGDKPLMKAILHKQEQCATILLQNGADPNVQNKYGASPLHWAIFCKNTSMLEKLLSFNANINAKTKDKKTPLLLALQYKRLEMAEYLIQKKADIHVVDKQGRTTLMLAVRCKSKNMVKLLLEGGVNVLAEDKSGDTALCYAVANRHKGSQNLILEHLKEEDKMIFNSFPAGENSKDDSFSRFSNESWTADSCAMLDEGHYQCDNKAQEQRKEKNINEMEASQNIYGSAEDTDSDSDGSFYERRSGSSHWQHFSPEDEEHEGCCPDLPMESAKETETEKWAFRVSVIPPSLGSSDLHTGALLQEEDGCHLSEIDQDEARSTTETSNEKGKAWYQTHAMEDHDDLESSERDSEDSEVAYPNYKHILRLIEELGMSCKDSSRLLQIENAIHSYQRIIELKKSGCSQCSIFMRKNAILENKISAVIKELTEATAVALESEQSRAEWKQEHCILRHDILEQRNISIISYRSKGNS